MQKDKVVDGQDASLCRQGQDGIVHITGDMEDSFGIPCLPPQVDQVEEDVRDASAGKRQEYLIKADRLITAAFVTDIFFERQCFGSHCTKYLFYAKKTGAWFAVYEVDGDVKRNDYSAKKIPFWFMSGFYSCFELFSPGRKISIDYLIINVLKLDFLLTGVREQIIE